jgi:hypothetical protein
MVSRHEGMCVLCTVPLSDLRSSGQLQFVNRSSRAKTLECLQDRDRVQAPECGSTGVRFYVFVWMAGGGLLSNK